MSSDITFRGLTLHSQHNRQGQEQEEGLRKRSGSEGATQKVYENSGVSAAVRTIERVRDKYNDVEVRRRHASYNSIQREPILPEKG